MTHVIEGKDCCLARSNGGALAAVNKFRNRLLNRFERGLAKKAGDRDLCCAGSELTTDVWFSGFPETAEQKLRVLKMYQKPHFGGDQLEGSHVSRKSAPLSPRQHCA